MHFPLLFLLKDTDKYINGTSLLLFRIVNIVWQILCIRFVVFQPTLANDVILRIYLFEVLVLLCSRLQAYHMVRRQPFSWHVNL